MHNDLQTSPIWLDDIFYAIDPEEVRFARYDHSRYRVEVVPFTGITIEFNGDRDAETILASVYTDRLYIEEAYVYTLEEARELIDYYS